MQRFTVYRRKISEMSTHNLFRKNPDDLPQYEGVIFSDGTVAIRWLTPSASTSVWKCIEDMLNVHGHPEYGTVIDWHDGNPPEAWSKLLKDQR